ncbi:hypothetical protein INT44_007591 [Umbelopsis vinacea]|uniref:Uncharacterized protein n=1 Tax=Umbelopsis vinacea TaxID=44442 RepID=A0A8H7PJH0_9FUNG|nr:hypothetical protein INT44_007591 [Umbelopsis vinacea]
MLDLPTLSQILLAEQQQIQLLLTIAEYAKVVTALPDHQKERDTQNLTQIQAQKHASNTENNAASVTVEEEDEEDVSLEVEIPQPQIDLWKPIGQTGDFDSFEHDPDTGIALNFENESQLQPLSPDIIPSTDLTHLPTSSPRHARQPTVYSRVLPNALPTSPSPMVAAKTTNGNINPSLDHVIIEPTSPSRSVEAQSQDDMEKRSHNETSETDDMTVPRLSQKRKTKAPQQDDVFDAIPSQPTAPDDIPSEIRDDADRPENAERRIIPMALLDMPVEVDDSVVPQFNDDEDDVYIQGNHIEGYSKLNGSTIMPSDKRNPKEKIKKVDQSIVTYRGSSPGGTAVDIIEILDTPSPPDTIQYKEHTNNFANNGYLYPSQSFDSDQSIQLPTDEMDIVAEQVNIEDLDMAPYTTSQSVSEKIAAMDDRERALATRFKPLRAKRLRYSRSGLSRSYAKSMNVKQANRGWIKRRR